jgi:hypothetical protein
MLTATSLQIGHRLSHAEEPRHPANKWLLAYWQARRGEDGTVARADLIFSDLKSLLPGFFVVEPVEEASDFVFRLAGTDIEERLDMRLTGRRFSECYAPHAGPIDFYAEVLREVRPRTLYGQFLGRGIEHADFESLHLPVRSGSGGAQICGTMFDMDQRSRFR